MKLSHNSGLAYSSHAEVLALTAYTTQVYENEKYSELRVGVAKFNDKHEIRLNDCISG
jgi:hypothetical protein